MEGGHLAVDGLCVKREAITEVNRLVAAVNFLVEEGREKRQSNGRSLV